MLDAVSMLGSIWPLPKQSASTCPWETSSNWPTVWGRVIQHVYGEDTNFYDKNKQTNLFISFCFAGARVYLTDISPSFKAVA